MGVRAEVAVVLFFVAAVVACANERGKPIAVKRSAIIGGTPVGAQTAVVPLVGTGGCSGTLVAPNLILTAKHCVVKTSPGKYTCDATGNLIANPNGGAAGNAGPPGVFGPVEALDEIRVGHTSPLPPHVAQVLVSPGNTCCQSDLAMLVLDRSMDDSIVAPIRLDSTPAVGDSLTAMGFGLALDKGFGNLQQRSVTVLHVGPSDATTDDDGMHEALSPGFFEVGEAPCHGDSGSPVLDATGAIVGVASDIDNPQIVVPSGTARDCVGPGTRGIYSSLSAQKDFILRGFAAANAQPWLAGQPAPPGALKDAGATCANDADCKSNVCIPGESGGACPQGFPKGDANDTDGASDTDDAGIGYAVPAATQHDGCAKGCAETAGRANHGWPAVLVAAFLVRTARRRRRA
jgi:hypothetical protein